MFHFINGNTLQAASAVPDPYFKKRKTLTKEQLEKQKLAMNMSADELLKNSTVPLWSMPYDQQVCDNFDFCLSELNLCHVFLQLLTKKNNIQKVLSDLTYQLLQDNKHTKTIGLLEERSKQNNGTVCELSDVRHVPLETVSKGYRNKCEFSIGKSTSTMDF